jgi:very-short-patch-repair endonuclease
MPSERARQLRKDMTSAERLLWWALCKRMLDGARFRRQHPLGSYTVDFVCLERMLVVEVDGGQHAEPTQHVHDAARTYWLEGEGYAVVRVWNRDVFTNLDGVLATIYAALQERPVRSRGRHPHPKRHRT